MRVFQSACLGTLLLVLAGCATTPPPLQGALGSSTENHGYGIDEAIILGNSANVLLDPKSPVVYIQNQGGGGAGVGLLLGPLGVLANAKMIDGVTQADVEKLKGKIQLNPESAFREAAAATAFPVKPSLEQADVKIAPFILISKTNETTLHVSPVVLFVGTNGERKWQRRYQFQLSRDYTLDDLAGFDQASSSRLQAECVAGFALLLKQIPSETAESIAKEKRVTVKSEYLTPRFVIPYWGSVIALRDDRVWVRTVLGVYAIKPSSVTYEAVKE